MNLLKKVNAALQLLSRGQVAQAAETSAKLLSQVPDSAPVHYLAGEVAIARNRPQDALGHLRRAAELDDQQPDLLMRKAHVEVICRQGLEARRTAEAAAARFPANFAVQLEAARIFAECGDHAGAEVFLQKAGELEPSHPRLLFERSTNQFYLGKLEQAEASIADYLALNLPVKGRKLLLRSRLRKVTSERNHVDELENYLAGSLQPPEAVNAYFALAKELEDLGEYARSFEALASGAAMQRERVSFDLAAEMQNIGGLIETFQPGSYAEITGSASLERPVFVLGMPRTGTTLVERMVSQQEGTRSSDESYDFTLAFSTVIDGHIAANPGRNLNPLLAALEADYDEIARIYHSSMQGMLGEAEFYIDKTPFNFLYCGLIRKAFPRARIIHLVRNPMDTCYAVFKTLFDKAYYYSYDLEELAEYYLAYRRLMDHWHRLMPGAILDVHYEALVTDPVRVSKEIAEFVDQQWSERLVEVQDFEQPCATASAAQVREPIYNSSIGLWRNYASELEPLRQKLEAGGIDLSD